MFGHFLALVAFAVLVSSNPAYSIRSVEKHPNPTYDIPTIAEAKQLGTSIEKPNFQNNKLIAFWFFGEFLHGNPFSGITWPGDTYRLCKNNYTIDQCVGHCVKDGFHTGFGVYLAHLSYHHGYNVLTGMIGAGGGGGGGGGGGNGPHDRRSATLDKSMLLPHPVEIHRNNLTAIPGHSLSGRLANTTWDAYGHEQRYYESELLDLTTGEWKHGEIHHNVTSGVNMVQTHRESAEDYRRRTSKLERRKHHHHHHPKSKEGTYWYLFKNEDKKVYDKINFNSATIGRLTAQVVNYGKHRSEGVFCADLVGEGSSSKTEKVNRSLFAFFTSKREDEKTKNKLLKALDDCGA